MNGPCDRSQEPSARAEVTDKHTAGNGVLTAAPESAVVPVALEDVAPRQVSAFSKEGRDLEWG